MAPFIRSLILRPFDDEPDSMPRSSSSNLGLERNAAGSEKKSFFVFDFCSSRPQSKLAVANAMATANSVARQPLQLTQILCFHRPRNSKLCSLVIGD